MNVMTKAVPVEQFCETVHLMIDSLAAAHAQTSLTDAKPFLRAVGAHIWNALLKGAVYYCEKGLTLEELVDYATEEKRAAFAESMKNGTNGVFQIGDGGPEPCVVFFCTVENWKIGVVSIDTGEMVTSMLFRHGPNWCAFTPMKHQIEKATAGSSRAVWLPELTYDDSDHPGPQELEQVQAHAQTIFPALAFLNDAISASRDNGGVYGKDLRTISLLSLDGPPQWLRS